MRRVINNEVNLDDFPPFRGDSKSSPTGAVHGSSTRVSPSREHSKNAGAAHGPSTRVSPSRKSSKASSSRLPSDGNLHGDSKAGANDDLAGASSSRVPPPVSLSSDAIPSWQSHLRLNFNSLLRTQKDGKKFVHISKTVLDKGAFLWGDCLVGKFFGISPKLAVI